MTSKTFVMLLALGFLAFEGTKLCLRNLEPPPCHSDPAIKGLIAALADPGLGTVAVNNAVTVSSGLFSAERDCTADIAALRGGVDAADMHWLRVSYQVKTGVNPDQADVAAQRGTAVALAPERSDFARWVEYFLD